MKEFPTAIEGAMRALPQDSYPGVMAINGLECAGAKFHSPTPLVLHRVDLADGAVLLCGTCRSNVAVLAALKGHHGELPWPVRREFGNRLRALLIPKESDA